MTLEETKLHRLFDLFDEMSTTIRCPMHGDDCHPIMGNGYVDSPLMIIGEAPGEEEEKCGAPFVGRSGKLLDRILEQNGIARNNVYVTNIVKCRPPDNRDPKAEEVDLYLPYLLRQIYIVQPQVIITLGNFSSRALLNKEEGITTLRGHSYPRAFMVPPLEDDLGFTRYETQIRPTVHPAAALRSGDMLSLLEHDIGRVSQQLGINVSI